VVHIGSNPLFIAFILRPGGEVTRHSYRNIKENGFYSINPEKSGRAGISGLNSYYGFEKIGEFPLCEGGGASGF